MFAWSEKQSEPSRGRNWATITRSLNSKTYYVLHNCIPMVQNAILACDQIKLCDEIESTKSVFEATSSLLVCMLSCCSCDYSMH